MPVKINVATKRLALEKLRDGLTAKEVADLTGVSVRTLKTWKQNSGIPGRNPAKKPAATPATPVAQKGQEEQDEKTTLDFQDSPAPIEKKGPVDTALSSLKGMLGIGDKQDDKAAPQIISAKLDAKRQQFVDSASPTLALAAMALASWLWGRIGPEYSQLAPDEKVAQRIVEPLLRVYARHANFLTDINPDVADIGASMFALVGYVHVSLGIYQQIKQEKEEYEQQGDNGILYQRGYRNTQPESRPGDTSSRHADVQRPGGDPGSLNGSNGGHPGGVNIPHLPDKEARQYAALSRLSQLDYQHRARRSGRFS